MSGGFISFTGEIRSSNPDVKKFVLARTYDELLATQSRDAIGLLTVSQAFSPDASKPPFYAGKPFKMQGNKVVPNLAAYNKWLDKDVVKMAEKYKGNLLELKAIRFDAGDEDEYKFIPINSRLFSKKLTSLHIPHQFEEYNGDHRNRLWGLTGRIYNEVLAFVYDNMLK